MEDEESSAHDDNTIQTTCNICGQTFKNKVEVNAHVKSAHFGMKDLNKDSQVVVNLDDEPDEDMLSDSYDEMIVDNDSVCSLCYCIFKDNIDLKSHIRLAHQDKLAESLPSKCNNNVLESAEIYIDTNDTCYKADAVPSESVVKKLDKATREHDYTNDSENNSYCHKSDDVFDDKGGDGSVNECEEKLGKIDDNGNKNLQSNLSDTVIIEDEDDARKDNSDNATNKMYERVICNICVKEFEDRNSLTGHIRSDHFGITSYKCAMCSLSFENRNQVIKHYNNCTGNSEQIKNSEDSENSTCNSNVSVASANRVKGKAKNAKIVSKKYLEKMIASAKKEKKKPAGEQSRRSSTRIAEINSRKAENSKRSRLPHIKKNTAKKIYKKSILRKARKFGQLQVVDSKESIRPCFICGDKYFSTSEGDNQKSAENRDLEKAVVSQPVDAIRIENTFKRSLDPVSTQLKLKQSLTHTVDNNGPSLKKPFQNDNFGKVEVIPALEGNSCSIKQVKTERLINPADKKLKQIKSSEESSVEPSDTNSKRYGSQESGLRFLSNLTTCNICSSVSPSAKRVFFDSKSIVRHMAEHKGQQPKFICYDCNTEFNSQGVWKRHITVAHPLCMILECDYKDCTMEFQRPQDLQKHIFSEHCHMFGCAECLAPFNSEQELISHSEAMHGKT
ncbi:hypothetical protein ACHWQZ_G014357 [Mnemiopsis leidyi]